MKRKIGDKVRVRKDLIEGKRYDSFDISEDTVQYLGNESKISDLGIAVLKNIN